MIDKLYPEIVQNLSKNCSENSVSKVGRSKKILTEISQIISIAAHVVLLQLYWLISAEVRALNLSKKNSEL